VGRRRRRSHPPVGRGDQLSEFPPMGALQSQRTLSGRGERWVERTIPGAAALKDYRCPGCDQVIFRGKPHVVAWPDGVPGGSELRRHWHTHCWRRECRRLGLTRAAPGAPGPDESG